MVQNAFSYRRVSIAKLYLYGAGVLYVDANEKRRVLKDPADYRPASNSYPSQLYGGMNDAPGPSEFVRSLGIRFALRILSFISGTYIGNSTRQEEERGTKKKTSQK